MRKNLTITLFCIALQCLSLAGLYAKKAYLTMQWESCKKNEAVFYYEVPSKTVDRIYNITVYYSDDVMYCQGSFNDEEVSKSARNGVFTYYFRTGKLMCKGSFTEGEKSGHWEIYYSEGGMERAGVYEDNNQVGKWLYYDKDQNITDTVDVVPQNYTGEFIKYYKGKISDKTNYANGKFHGLSEEYFYDGTLSSRGEYDSNKRINEWVFYHKNGNIASRTIFGKDERVDSVYYFNEEGVLQTDPIDTAYIYKRAGFSDNEIQKIIGKNLMYPPLAVEYGIQGRIMVQFVIKADGSVRNVKCIDDIKLDFGMEEECIKVINEHFKFSPHKFFNTPSSVKYKMPIKFRLM
jgi:antitoxin component YwqK of YwqJK toxin-antitoxin module